MTAVEHDWSRTHAVVVAVESYRGFLEPLDGPANDAIRVLRWLAGKGVPPRNVHLLASPLDDNAEALAKVAPPSYRPADRATVRAVFRDELRDLDTDWLWIYWAGHGIQAQGDRWSLLYPEASDTDLVGLDADNLVHLLRTDCLPRRSVHRVTMVVDACREALTATQQALASPPDRLCEDPQTTEDRPLFLLRAARPGGIAKNHNRAGLFTSVLFDQLEGADSGRGLDLAAAWAAARRDFERRRAEHGLHQFPTVSVSDWDGQESRFSLPAPLTEAQLMARKQLVFETVRLLGATTGAGVAARLCEEFTGEPPVTTAPTPEELVDWALRIPHGVATLLQVLAEQPPGQMSGQAPGQTPGQSVSPGAWAACRTVQGGQWLTCAEYATVVRLLDGLDRRGLAEFAAQAREEIPGVRLPQHEAAALVDALETLLAVPHRLPQLLRAVERFAAPGGQAQADPLRAWSRGCARRLGLEPVLLDRRAEARERAEHRAAAAAAEEDLRIQVRLGEPTGSRRLRTFAVWSSRGADDFDTLATVDTPTTLEEIQRRLDLLLEEHAPTQETLVEVFVAATDLEVEAHRWPRPASGPFERSLGTDFPVVMRCADLRARQRHLWRRRWERVGDADVKDLHWLPQDLPLKARNVYGALQTREDAPGVVTCAPAGARAEVFAACLFGGVPVLVWHGGIEQDAEEAELEGMLGQGKLSTLPGHVRRLRSQSDAYDRHPGKHLALLWDDPGRPLPDQPDLWAP